MRWVGYVACIIGKIGVLLVLVGKRPVGRPRRRWEDDIKMDLQEVGFGRAWTGSSWLRLGTRAGHL